MKTAVLALALLALAAGPPPANVMKCSMSADGLVEVFLTDGKLQFFYPRVLVFNENGAYVFGSQGYSGHMAADILKAARNTPQKNAPRIEAFAKFLRGPDGKAIDPAALRGKETVAQLGAEWCGPCHQLEADLRRAGGINLLLIDADSKGRIDELREALKKRLGKQ
jgi:thiol-disulfide isomerase/thioredoxin